MPTQILVPFDGDGAGAAGLTWGQRNIWIPIRRHHTSLAIGGTCPLPAGVTVDDVAAQLRLLVSRHQSLRTRVEFDLAADRRARQVLAASGEIPLEVVDGGQADDGPARAAESSAVAFARAVGASPVLAQVLLSNRFRPGLADSISPVVQPGLVAIDVAGVTFDEVVTRAWHATVQASMHSYYDPYALAELNDAMLAERGEEVEIRCFLNDRRMQSLPEGTEPAPSAGQLHAALGRSTLRWDEPTDQSDEPFMASIEDVPGTVACTVSFDTHYISPARVEAFLREMEAALVSAAFDPAARTGIAPAPPAVRQ
jgi:hypothetical protein